MGWGGYGKGGYMAWQPMFMPMWGGKGKGKSKGRGVHDFPIEQRVWLGSVPDPFDPKALKEHMSQAGNCKYISVKKGQGGATYATAAEAQTAVAMLNGSVFAGAYIEVDVWTEKPKDPTAVTKGKGKGKKGKW
eukprot:gnl/TRDRNA2_/TRDRNA2_175383_c0_seq3.p1 gnl/TRDRNA2_/TRDRNA2_175383_c0~~gnl/TRDRNA2_/TRDRNA2_175383_c0_seq3.p1  ORF type:complete len:133 (+),score=35.18 gnl/TRDRNA2_/TRDRNA2_175383_c0_seq3:185-583(+)